MSNKDFILMMKELTVTEEKKLGTNSLEFQERHNEIMNECNKQFISDLMMEQKETM